MRSKHNLVQSQVFSEKLKKTLNAYHNRAISTLEVIEELIKVAKEMEAAAKRGEDLGLTDDEIAFYDALAANHSAVVAMGDEKLKVIAAELITQVKKSVTIDWTLRESARAKVMVKRILNRYGNPPDLQEEGVKTVLAQAELLCAGSGCEEQAEIAESSFVPTPGTSIAAVTLSWDSSKFRLSALPSIFNASKRRWSS